MKHARLVLIPAMMALAACQVGVGYGPVTSPSATPSIPMATSSPDPGASPSLIPASSPSPPAPTPVPVPTPTPAPVIGQAVSFSILLDRNTSVNNEERTLVFSDMAGFTNFWATHANTQRGGAIRLEQPSVDFSKNTVLAVHQSMAPTASLGYEISAVYLDGRTLRVHYRQRTMQKGFVYLSFSSSTIHAVSIPLSKAAGNFDDIVFILDAPQPTEAFNN